MLALAQIALAFIAGYQLKAALVKMRSGDE